MNSLKVRNSTLHVSEFIKSVSIGPPKLLAMNSLRVRTQTYACISFTIRIGKMYTMSLYMVSFDHIELRKLC